MAEVDRRQPDVSSGVRALGALVGTWRGHGAGDYPTMEPFDYEEEIVFSWLTERSVRYLQRAWSPAGGETLHSENGIWRAAHDGRLEVTIALPGVAEVSEGTLVEGSIRLQSTSISRAAGGAGLAAAVRRYDVDGHTLSYDIHMGTVDVSTQPHIRATLSRSG